MNETQVLLLFRHYTAIAEEYQADVDLVPSQQPKPDTLSPATGTDIISVVWHDRTGLIISEAAVNASSQGDAGSVHEIYAPDADTDLKYQSRIPGTHSLFAVGDILLYNKNVPQPDNTTLSVPTFKIRYYSKTPDRFRNYVENTVRLFSQQTSNVY